jgi:hypothetical protein
MQSSLYIEIPEQLPEAMLPLLISWGQPSSAGNYCQKGFS